MQQRYYESMSGEGSSVAAAEFSVTERMSSQERSDAFKALKPAVRTDKAIEAATGLISSLEKKNIFVTPASQEAAKNALSWDKENADPRKGLKGIIDALESVPSDVVNDNDAEELKNYITEYVQVKDPEGNLVPYSEWQIRLAAATPEERAKLENEGLYGFVFPKEEGEVPPENQLLESYKTKVQGEIAKLRESQQDTSSQEAFLGRLTTATQANGEIGVLLKASVMREIQGGNLASDEERSTLSQTLSGLKEQEDAAKLRLVDHLRQKGMSDDEIVQAQKTITEQGIGAFLGHPDLKTKLAGIDQLMFNTAMDNNKLADMLIPFLDQKNRELATELKKHGGDICLVLLLLLIAPIAAGAVVTAEATKNIH